MKHKIEMRKDMSWMNVEKGGTTQALALDIGTQSEANVRCYVIHADEEHFTEVADIEFPQGMVKGVPCSAFMFIDLFDSPRRNNG